MPDILPGIQPVSTSSGSVTEINNY